MIAQQSQIQGRDQAKNDLNMTFGSYKRAFCAKSKKKINSWSVPQQVPA